MQNAQHTHVLVASAPPKHESGCKHNLQHCSCTVCSEYDYLDNSYNPRHVPPVLTLKLLLGVMCASLAAIRGTKNVSDVITDISGSSTPLDGGRVHWGMLQATKVRRHCMPRSASATAACLLLVATVAACCTQPMCGEHTCHMMKCHKFRSATLMLCALGMGWGMLQATKVRPHACHIERLPHSTQCGTHGVYSAAWDGAC